MDYSELSDYEVSKRVAMAVGGFLEEDFCETHSVIFRRHGRHQYSFFEPCTNPNDAWPIIAESRISILFDGTDSRYEGEHHQWCDAISPCQKFGIQHQLNPLRAAMIVFLMMQESANVPTNSTGSDLR